MRCWCPCFVMLMPNPVAYGFFGLKLVTPDLFWQKWLRRQTVFVVFFYTMACPVYWELLSIMMERLDAGYRFTLSVCPRCLHKYHTDAMRCDAMANFNYLNFVTFWNKNENAVLNLLFDLKMGGHQVIITVSAYRWCFGSPPHLHRMTWASTGSATRYDLRTYSTLPRLTLRIWQNVTKCQYMKQEHEVIGLKSYKRRQKE